MSKGDRSWMDEDPGECGTCGEPWQLVRPGKSQSVCDCDETCPIHGPNKFLHHDWNEAPPGRRIAGWYCMDCETSGAE